jgi:AraC-like DNA-binding protein
MKAMSLEIPRRPGWAMDIPRDSARFVEPFAQILSTYDGYSVESLAKWKAVDPASRISAAAADEWTVRQVRRTGDPDLGLKAGRSMPLGRAGPLAYAMHSAASLRQAADLARRYARLFSDRLEVHCEIEGGRAMVHVDVGPTAPRPIRDFAMSAWFTNHVREPLRDVSGVECWFSHPEPQDRTEYERTFSPATLRFDAPCCAFSFATERFDAPLASSDPVLHVLLCEHAGFAFQRLCAGSSLTAQVRHVANPVFLRGRPTMHRIARELGISPRTLRRGLEREGTTFKAVLDHLRHERALRYLGSHEMGCSEIARQLGFSQVEGFYRAFKRWTGRTPLRYRRERALQRADSKRSRRGISSSIDAIVARA